MKRLHPINDSEETKKRTGATLESVINWFEDPARMNTRLIGRVLTSGNRLEGRTGSPYCRQFDFMLLEKTLLQADGSTIEADKLLAELLKEVPPWIDDLVQSTLGNRLYSRSHVDYNQVTHQGRIIRELLKDNGEASHLLCKLPLGSGRTTAAFLAALEILTSRMGSVLYIAPTPLVARRIARRAHEFFISSGWRDAISLALLIEMSGNDDLKHLIWDPLETTHVPNELSQELLNFVVTTPEFMERHLLRKHADHRHFLADLQLVILDGAEQYYGTYGSHVSLILRRLRRLLKRYGARYRTFTAVAPHKEALNHVRVLFGFDDDRDAVKELSEILANEDEAPQYPRMVATWTPPLRFKEVGGPYVDPTAPVVGFSSSPKRLSSRDGLQNLLSSVAHALSRETHELFNKSEEERATRIVVLSRPGHIEEDDLKGWTTSGYSIDLVHSLHELDTKGADLRALVVFGFMGEWASLLHEIAHFGVANGLIVVAGGADALSRSFVRNAERSLLEQIRGIEQYIDAEDKRVAYRVLDESTELLNVDPHAIEPLKLHLYLAASIEGGIVETEIDRFFGPRARVALAKLRDLHPTLYREETVGVGAKAIRRFIFDPGNGNGPPIWDPHCVVWDLPGKRHHLLDLQIVDEGARTMGCLEKLTISTDIVAGKPIDYGEVWLRGRRRLLARTASEWEVETTYARSMEFRPRLSRFEFTCPPDVVKHGDTREVFPPDRISQEPDGNVEFCLTPINVHEEIVGEVQADGYATHDLHLVRYEKPRRTAFLTQGLLLRFATPEEPVDDLIHSIEHLIKIILPRFLRFDPPEVEIRMDARREWHIVIYDSHPHGECFSKALYGRSASWWRRLFETGYQLLKDCPCHEGCWQCLKVFDCREFAETKDNAGNSILKFNEGVNKKSLFSYLGKRLDKQWNLHWAFKAGESPTEDEKQFLDSFVRPWIRNQLSTVLHVLRDKCGFDIPQDIGATLILNPDIPTPGIYLSGPNEVHLWPPGKSSPRRLKEQDYITLLAHEYTHNWQFKSGRFHSKLVYYNFDNVEDPNNIPYRGKLFIEGLARWAETMVCDYFGLDAHMIQVRNEPVFSEYQAGYRLFLFLEYHVDFARFLDFLKTSEILIQLPLDAGWALIENARDYEKYLYDDSRLGILNVMTDFNTAPSNAAMCLREYDRFKHCERDGSTAHTDPPRVTYLLGPKNIDLMSDAKEGPIADIEGYLKDLEKDLKWDFNLRDSVGKVLEPLAEATLEDLGLRCAACLWKEAKKDEKESAGLCSEWRPCTIVDACHLHSSGAEGRSTRQLLMKIQEALGRSKEGTLENSLPKPPAEGEKKRPSESRKQKTRKSPLQTTRKRRREEAPGKLKEKTSKITSPNHAEKKKRGGPRKVKSKNIEDPFPKLRAREEKTH